jgi:RHS repeat-associated protein
LSTLSRAQSLTDWDRGCLAFYYSVNNQAWGGSGTDNNGNVTKAEIYVPNADGSYNMQQDQYSYDSLNRLQSVNELQTGTQVVFTQAFTYDRWGNRQINQSASTTNVNRQQFSINTANNRLGVPNGQSGQMTYDASGNLTADTYSRMDASRVYDGENRLATNTDTSNQVSRYTYDASGKRVRRIVNNQETWQVYGIGGELISEYAANASPTTVQKEYGYRGGQLLVTATNTAEVQWLIGDHLGTPRMIADKTGTLAGIKRHDYLPFGEEVFAGTGGRTAQQGYATDNVRQKFTKYERDSETGLDWAEARYFSSTQGRFTSADTAGPDLATPQTLNKYQYSFNNPLRYVDPDGLYGRDVHRDLTFALAFAAGYSFKEASQIASANQGTDDNIFTSPLIFPWSRKRYHVTSRTRRDEMFDSFVNSSGDYFMHRRIHGRTRDTDGFGDIFLPVIAQIERMRTRIGLTRWQWILIISC